MSLGSSSLEQNASLQRKSPVSKTEESINAKMNSKITMISFVPEISQANVMTAEKPFEK
jgi:hypothetical protein